MRRRTLAESGTGKSSGGRRPRIAATCVAGILLASIPAGAAHAADHISVELPIRGASAVVATDTRVFISGGVSSTDVLVTDVNGAVVTKLPRLAGATGLALSPDQHTLYIALSNAGAIAVIDTETLKETARFRVSGCPRSLAVAGRYLLFGYGCNGGWDGNIGRVDLEQPSAVTKKLVHSLSSSPDLAIGKDLTTLVVGELGSDPSTVIVYHIGPDASLTELRRSRAVGSNLTDVAVSPDSTTVLTAAGHPYTVQEFPIDQLETPVRRYATGSYPSAVQVSPDGAYVAGGVLGIYVPDVHFFDRDGTLLASYETGGDLLSRGLAWSPDGSRLYAVSFDSSASSPARLHVFPRPSP